ncbi:MFS transporter [Thermodesulfobacteriota bacterium]
MVKRTITIPLSIIIFVSVLNGVMFNIAIPDIAHEFSLKPSEVSWVITGFIITFALGSIIYGKLADIYSLKELITLGLLLLNVGSLIGFFAPSYPILILARLVQAAGGASIPALAMIIGTRYLPLNVRGKVLGVIASSVSLGMGIGPILGGFIADSLQWRYLFFITLITVVTIPVLRRMLPKEGMNYSRFDILGAILLGGGVAAFLLSITLNLWLLLPVGLGLFALFMIHIKTSPEPIISPSVFSNRLYRNILYSMFIFIGTVYAVLFMTPIMLRDLNDLSSNLIGFTIFPGAICAALFARLGGRFSDSMGSKIVVYAGLMILLTGFLTLSTFAGHEPLIVALFLILFYIGFSFLQTSIPHMISLILPEDHLGVGMGIYNLCYFSSGAFSAAIIGRLLDYKVAEFCVNPFSHSKQAWIYSNLFILLAFMLLLGTGLFYVTFRQRAT